MLRALDRLAGPLLRRQDAKPIIIDAHLPRQVELPAARSRSQSIARDAAPERSATSAPGVIYRGGVLRSTVDLCRMQPVQRLGAGQPWDLMTYPVALVPNLGLDEIAITLASIPGPPLTAFPGMEGVDTGDRGEISATYTTRGRLLIAPQTRHAGAIWRQGARVEIYGLELHDGEIDWPDWQRYRLDGTDVAIPTHDDPGLPEQYRGSDWQHRPGLTENPDFLRGNVRFIAWDLPGLAIFDVQRIDYSGAAGSAATSKQIFVSRLR